MEEYKSSKRISVYLSMPSEVQTEGILKVILSNLKQFDKVNNLVRENLHFQVKFLSIWQQSNMCT